MNQPQQIGDLTENDCSSRLAGMFNDADVHMAWPVDTATLAEVLRSGGAYDLTAEVLENWARTKSVGVVPIQSGRFAWSAGNALAAAGLANASRRWLLSSKHIAKMSGAELASLQANALGECLFSDLEEVDLQTLIGVIAGCEDKDMRSTLCLGLVAKLRKDGVIV